MMQESLTGIRALCFDLDNTFWDVMPVIERAEQAMYDFLALRYPRVTAAMTVEMLRKARVETARAYPQMAHDFTFLRRQTLADHAREFGYAEAMADEAFEAFIQARNEVVLYDDVLPGLERLKQHFRLFTASNGNADLERIGLAHYFERSLCARQVGALKPDPRLFHKVIEGTGLEPQQVVYVGDDPALDVVGARAAGMVPVWINREQVEWPTEHGVAAHTVRTLDELAVLLGLQR
ncbi:HAD family hydrolase [Steroidobacter sp. S1-65]|uniref:HAD family hydrolase n=1 Tax=Steroidobacter gossypii TaxID=2805490 RepID=A0ABS1X2X6_9GAMM|nr:HAD family hydrolase [Steroidobacter gossypii]MBM0107572.1 HAD family hydrolase [Steroidobacter gossypii]